MDVGKLPTTENLLLLMSNQPSSKTEPPIPDATPGMIWQRVSESVILIITGLIMLYYHGSGLIVHYLREDFRPYLLWGAVGLIVVGIFHLWFARATTTGESRTESGTIGIAGRGAWLVWIIAMAPMAWGLAHTTHRYSTDSAARKGLFDDAASLATGLPLAGGASLLENASQNEDGYYRLGLDQIFFSALYEEDRDALSGVMIELESMATQRPGGEAVIRLYDLLVMCCAADARAVGIDARYAPMIPDELLTAMNEAGEQQQPLWLRIRGTLDFGKTDSGQWAAFLSVDGQEVIPPPTTPFDD